MTKTADLALSAATVLAQIRRMRDTEGLERIHVIAVMTTMIAEDKLIPPTRIEDLTRANAALSVAAQAVQIIDRLQGGDFPQTDEDLVANLHRIAARTVLTNVTVRTSSGTCSDADRFEQAAWAAIYQITELD